MRSTAVDGGTGELSWLGVICGVTWPSGLPEALVVHGSDPSTVKTDQKYN